MRKFKIPTKPGKLSIDLKIFV